MRISDLDLHSKFLGEPAAGMSGPVRLMIRLIPLVKEPWLPDTSVLQAVIYEAIGRFDHEYKCELHEEGFRPKSGHQGFQPRKLFVFSLPRVESARVRDGRLYFDCAPMLWKIGSAVPYTLTALRCGLEKNPIVSMAGQRFAVEAIEECRPPRYRQEMRFVALSPVVALGNPERGGMGEKESPDPASERFAQIVEERLQKQFRIFSDEPPGKIEFTFDWDYIRRRRDRGDIVKRVLYKKSPIDGIRTPFIVRGDERLIRIGWESGFGSANSKGFGMAE